ncbi:MAG: tRNA pseudouridine(55) synthase TruB [Zetaproteobacteria bacterium]|nr:MAG: tRNA pseudouridine(55) synthase TruB [Zetaproteobacteria bacterium]
MTVSGVIFLDKPYGWSSRRAVNEVMRCMAEISGVRPKAGHAGTLDPLATGMLPILLGEATRFADHGLNAKKSYLVEIDLSYQTDTLDKEGVVVARFPERPLAHAQLRRVLQDFVGTRMQVPPAYSAVRIAGKRAHALARAGAEVALPARQITIHQLKLEWLDGMCLALYVACSKGTYIRALARDLGERLGLGGCVTALRRLGSGSWGEEHMVTIEQFRQRGLACMVPLSDWLRDLPVCRLNRTMACRFVQGQRLQLAERQRGEVAVFTGTLLLGTGELRQGMRHAVLHPRKVLPSARVALTSKQRDQGEPQ